MELEKMIVSLKNQYEIEGEMTLRRCWYVLLSKHLVKEHPHPKNQSQKNAPYQRLSQILLKARIDRLLSWDIIVDRTRRVDKRQCWSSPEQAVKAMLNYFRYDALNYQDNYVEVWVEKDAVSSTVSDVTDKYYVPLIVAKGFSSGTYLKNASVRFNDTDKPVTVLYLSDMDPEGEYFPKLIKEQLATRYGCTKDITVKKICLNNIQVDKWGLPYIDLTMHPIHRRKKYVADFLRENGQRKVEMDAVDNNTLSQVIEKNLKSLVDADRVKEVTEKSKRDAKRWAKKHGVGGAS